MCFNWKIKRWTVIERFFFLSIWVSIFAKFIFYYKSAAKLIKFIFMKIIDKNYDVITIENYYNSRAAFIFMFFFSSFMLFVWCVYEWVCVQEFRFITSANISEFSNRLHCSKVYKNKIFSENSSFSLFTCFRFQKKVEKNFPVRVKW